MRRLRQVAICGDVYREGASVMYNDAESVFLATAGEVGAFRERLLAEGWKKESEAISREDWREEYSLAVEGEAERPGLFALARRGTERDGVAIARRFCESGTAVVGAVAGETIAAVGLMDGRWVAYLLEGPRLAARVVCVGRQARPAVALGGGWWFVGTAAGVQAYRRGAEGWAFHSGFGEKNVQAVAAARGRVAVLAGELQFYVLREGRWEGEAVVEVEGEALALGEGVAAVGAPGRFGGSGCVHMFVEQDGEWVGAQCLRLADGRMGDGFGSGLWLEGGELTVAGKKDCWVFGSLEA